MTLPLPTSFAPAERASDEVVLSQMRALAGGLGQDPLLDSVSEILAILNEERQLVYANRRLLELLDTSLEDVLGKRPGEVLGCIHSDETPGGCGTTESCRECGALQAVLVAQGREQAVRECRILTRAGGALDLRVWATPMELDGRLFTVFAASDISSEKRREVLERTFFHDILNTAGIVLGATHLLRNGEEATREQFLELVARGSEQLVEEINSHRDLLSAEKGGLQSAPGEVDSLVILEGIRSQYSSSLLAEDRTITVDEGAEAVEFKADRVLLVRVLGNLLKNALEATEAGGTVTLSCRLDGEQVLFSVHNPAVMSQSVQLQLFQRSFSTKGTGRGIGTYSIKLFTENYLGGQVQFESEEPMGTTFQVMLPYPSFTGVRL
jgi:signal transduction histidine kinase